MAEKPILFSAPMVRALLDGRKTQTRRVLPPVHPKFHEFDNLSMDVMIFDPEKPEAWYWDGVHDGVGASYGIRCAVGDRLWVRESLARQETDQGVGYKTYAADGAKVWPLTEWYNKRPSVPSIHMPRWASRLTLIVTDVRVQRLQDCSEADAMAEGATAGEAMDEVSGIVGAWSARSSFRAIWNSINGPEAWDANPWVAAYSFRVIRANIDSKECCE